MDVLRGQLVVSIKRIVRCLLWVCAVFAVGGCSIFQRSEPVQVILAGMEPLPSEGLELRMLVKLRVQNPNETPIDFDGVFIEMDVQGKPFASGVSNTTGTIPRYGETVVNAPISISAFNVVRQAIGMANDQFSGKLAYRLRGKISGPGFGSVRFNADGELTMPAEIPARIR